MPATRFDKQAPDVTGTKPQKLRLGLWYCVPPTWAKAMEMAVRALLGSVKCRERLLQRIRAINGFESVSAAMRRPVKLENGLWMETNKSANDCLRAITALLKAAGYPLDQAELEYTSAKETSARDAKDQSADKDCASRPCELLLREQSPTGTPRE